MVNPPEEGPLEPTCLVPGWDKEELRRLSSAVIDTITQTKAPSTRWLYALSGTFALHDVIPKVKTHGDMALGQFFPSYKRALRREALVCFHS